MSNLPLFVLLPTVGLALIAMMLGLLAFAFNARLLLACLRGMRPKVSAALPESLVCFLLSAFLLWVCFPCIVSIKVVGMSVLALNLAVCVALHFVYQRNPAKVSAEKEQL